MTSNRPPDSPHGLQRSDPQGTPGQIDRTQSNAMHSNADENASQNGESQNGAQNNAQSGAAQNSLIPMIVRIKADETPPTPCTIPAGINQNSFDIASNTVVAQLHELLIAESGHRMDAVAPSAYGNRLVTAANAAITQQVAEGSSGGNTTQEEAEIREFDKKMALCLETMAPLPVAIEQARKRIQAKHGGLPEIGDNWERCLRGMAELQVSIERARRLLRESYTCLPPVDGGVGSGSGNGEGDAGGGEDEVSRGTDTGGRGGEEGAGEV